MRVPLTVHAGTFAVRCGGNAINVAEMPSVFNRDATGAGLTKSAVQKHHPRILIDGIHSESFSIVRQHCGSYGYLASAPF